MLTRLQQTEPARLYGYALTLVALIGLIVAGALTGDWSTVLPLLAGLVLAAPTATEATRASVYAPASLVGMTVDELRGQLSTTPGRHR